MTETTWIDIGLVSALFVGVCALLLSVVAIVSLRQRNRLDDMTIQRLQQELATLGAGAVGLGKRLLALEQQLREVERQRSAPVKAAEPVSSAPVAPAAPAFSEGAAVSDAARLLAMGIDAGEVARRCGLSRAEVSLMELMNAHNKASV